MSRLTHDTTMRYCPPCPCRHSPQVNPIAGTGPAEASWLYHNLNPALNLARKVRDLRQLPSAGKDVQQQQGNGRASGGKAQAHAEQEAARAEAAEWLLERDSVAADLRATASRS